MNLMRIDDFKCKASITEYLILYVTTSSFIIVSSATIFGDLNEFWAWLSIAVLLTSMTVLQTFKNIRSKRAQKFYREWLSALKPNEVTELKNRLKESCPEHKIIQEQIR